MLKPYGSTFLVFSDYMRPAVRLSALSQLPVDLGLDARLDRPRRGRPDAPARRAPDVRCARSRTSGSSGPGDANETVAAWRIALERDGGPVALALSRQKLPVLGGDGVADTREGALRGGYVLWQRDRGASPTRSCSRRARSSRIALEARTLARPQRARRLAPLLGAVRRAARRVPRRGAAAVGDGPRLDRGGRHVRLGALRRPGRARASASTASARPRPYERIYEELGLTAEAVADAVEARRLMQVALGFDHRGVPSPRRRLRRRRGRGHEALDLGVDTDAVRVDYPDIAQASATAIRDGRARAGRPRLRLRRRRLGGRVQDPGHPRGDLPRRVLGAPGRRARRHERALPRLGDRRAVARARAGRSGSSPRRSSARGAIWHGWRRSRSWNGSRRLKARTSMAASRLHELSGHGVSVWIDSLSREMLETGELARLMEEDAVVGVTSNPTIFQKALAEGDWYDEQLRAVVARDRRPDRDLHRARAGGHPRRLRPDGAGVGADGRRSTATSRSRSTRGSRTTARRPFDQAMRFHEEVDRKNLYVKIPGTEPGLGAIEDCIAKGRSINVTLIFSLERYARRRRGVPARPRAARRRRAAIPARCCPSRASSSPASTRRPTGGSRRSGRTDLQGQARRREREARLRALAARRSRATGGRSSRARARARSAASGRRRRRRTPPTATCSTSRS